MSICSRVKISPFYDRRKLAANRNKICIFWITTKSQRATWFPSRSIASATNVPPMPRDFLVAVPICWLGSGFPGGS
jgi:hypothetical protein